MKTIVLFAVLCLVACVSAGVGRGNFPPRSTGPTRPRGPGGNRFRREADPEPQGSMVLKGTKPLDGPDRRPTLDLNYNQRIFERNGARADAYGGVAIRPGERAAPHAGFEYERNFRNGFIRGQGQIERGSNSRFSPSVGVSGGWRFRREAEEEQF